MIRIYKLDVSKSEIAWVGFQPSGKQTGILHFKEGRFYTKGKNVMEADVLIDMESLEVTSVSLDEKNKLKLANHLKSPDFLDVERYPTVEFMFLDIRILDSSDEISSPGDPAVKVHTHEVEGELTIRGITQRVKLPVFLEIDDFELRAESKFLIYRTRWDMDFMIDASFGDKKILPEVQLSFDIVAHSAKRSTEKEIEFHEEDVLSYAHNM